MYLSPSFLWFTQAQRRAAGGERKRDGGVGGWGWGGGGVGVRRNQERCRGRVAAGGAGGAVIQGTGWVFKQQMKSS